MAKRPTHPQLCLVIPCYNEEPVLPQLIERLSTLKLEIPYRVLFVDDGSRDGTLRYLESVCASDERMACLSLSRNFGHQVAVSAGLRHAKGDVVVILDADLQDPPELLPDFLAQWHKGYDVVYGIRTNRKETFLMRMAYSVFYRLLDRSANVTIPRDSGDFALIDRRVVEVINSLPEHNRFVRGMRAWVGFRQTGVSYERPARVAGKSGYSLRKLITLALDGLTGFSTVPLRMAFWLGMGAFFWGIARLPGLVGQTWFDDWLPFANITTLILLLGGLQLAVLGIIGEYIGRILDEVRGRPIYVLKHRLGWAAESD